MSKPSWVRKRFSPIDQSMVRQVLKDSGLHTVCEQARCPNIGECFKEGTATFLILGKTCTRNCRFCAVEQGIPEDPDPEEPDRVASAVRKMGLHYVVVTSVTRDDLPDGGASHFAQTIRSIHDLDRVIHVEVLVPDFQGKREALEKVLKAGPSVLNHNVETIPRLYPVVRPQADFERSLALLQYSKYAYPQIPVKTGFMVGLGEMEQEVIELLHRLREAGCDLLTIGQYLQPRSDLLPVSRYVPPDEFEWYREKALEMGFKSVASGTFVRSSFQARISYQSLSSR